MELVANQWSVTARRFESYIFRYGVKLTIGWLERAVTPCPDGLAGSIPAGTTFGVSYVVYLPGLNPAMRVVPV